ncbi:defective proboscis extension response [Culex quinquefasciatus]|uniref:Defective proboscis extension response n=1 Tax=Culex quinquefasciatus TaxID=7176 RepID=B0WPK3_CULQU|nr:defective proboscis extension response [Culex quinquefasciatus]|eukprot:XP_001850637.1 defective proboscis extension response [Culex quinquefasciatus]
MNIVKVFTLKRMVTRSERSEVWTMQIKFAQQRDSGAYECQVNTVPKMSMTFQLNVVEAKALILGPTDIYVKIGSAVTLTCIITQGPHDLGTIFWYRGTNIIKPTETHPNETSVAAAAAAYPPRISVELKWTEALTSRLKIMDAKLSDSGNYTCMPTSAEASSVMVHVINGKPCRHATGWHHRQPKQHAVPAVSAGRPGSARVPVSSVLAAVAAPVVVCAAIVAVALNPFHQAKVNPSTPPNPSSSLVVESPPNPRQQKAAVATAGVPGETMRGHSSGAD